MSVRFRYPQNIKGSFVDRGVLDSLNKNLQMHSHRFDKKFCCGYLQKAMAIFGLPSCLNRPQIGFGLLPTYQACHHRPELSVTSFYLWQVHWWAKMNYQKAGVTFGQNKPDLYISLEVLSQHVNTIFPFGLTLPHIVGWQQPTLKLFTLKIFNVEKTTTGAGNISVLLYCFIVD